MFGMGREQHLHLTVSHSCALDSTGVLATSKSTVFFSSSAIAPELFEFHAKNVGQFCTVQAQQVIHVAAALAGISVAMDP